MVYKKSLILKEWAFFFYAFWREFETPNPFVAVVCSACIFGFGSTFYSFIFFLLFNLFWMCLKESLKGAEGPG